MNGTKEPSHNISRSWERKEHVLSKNGLGGFKKDKEAQ